MYGLLTTLKCTLFDFPLFGLTILAWPTVFFFDRVLTYIFNNFVIMIYYSIVIRNKGTIQMYKTISIEDLFHQSGFQMTNLTCHFPNTLFIILPFSSFVSCLFLVVTMIQISTSVAYEPHILVFLLMNPHINHRM